MTRLKNGVATFHRPLVDTGYPELVVITHYARSGPGCSTGHSSLLNGDGHEVDGAGDVQERKETDRIPVHVEFRVYPAGSLASKAPWNTFTASSSSAWRYVVAAFILAVVAISGRAVDLEMMMEVYLESAYAYFRKMHLVFALVGVIVISRLSTCTIYESVIAIPGMGIQFETKKGHRLPRSLRPRFTVPGLNSSILKSTPMANEPAASLCAELPASSWLSTTRTTFIPLSALRPVSLHDGAADSIIIHEALHRWSVKFYLAVMYCVKSGAGMQLDSSSIRNEDEKRRGEAWNVQVVFPTLQPRLPILREVYYGLREVMFDDFEVDISQPTKNNFIR